MTDRTVRCPIVQWYNLRTTCNTCGDYRRWTPRRAWKTSSLTDDGGYNGRHIVAVIPYEVVALIPSEVLHF